MAQRILEPGQIESLAQRSVPRVRLPDNDVFGSRAARLRALARDNAIGGYLQFLGAIAEAQQRALAALTVTLPDAASIAQAATYRMPPVPASGWKRDARWNDVLHDLTRDVAAAAAVPEAVGGICARIRGMPRDEVERMADELIAGHAEDIASAPIVMAALQVHWVALTKAFKAETVTALDVPGVCPLCGTLPVASIVRIGKPYDGYRYLHCGLCATEWHMVRVKCTHCYAVDGVAFQTIEGGPQSVRAETCEQCRTYRKILYQEKDNDVEPLADDLGSLSLDLLVSDAGYRRASANPLLWQPAEA